VKVVVLRWWSYVRYRHVFAQAGCLWGDRLAVGSNDGATADGLPVEELPRSETVAAHGVATQKSLLRVN